MIEEQIFKATKGEKQIAANQSSLVIESMLCQSDQQIIQQTQNQQYSCKRNKQKNNQEISTVLQTNPLNKQKHKQLLDVWSLAQIQSHHFKSEVTYSIINTVDKKRTYSCQLAHFLIPYSLLLLELYAVNKDNNTYLMKVFFYLKSKLQNSLIKNQLFQSNFNEYILFLDQFEIVSHQQTLQMLSTFLKREGKMMKAVCPYYYNFFAFAVNKEIIFGENQKYQKLQYTIQHQHLRYGSNFSLLDVTRQIERMQMALTKKYNSGMI